MFRQADIIRLKSDKGGWLHCDIDHTTLITVSDIIEKGSDDECTQCYEQCLGYCYKLDYVGNYDEESIFDGSEINECFDINALREKKIKRIIF